MAVTAMPFYVNGLFGDAIGLVIALLVGLAFGWFLERGGLGSARKLAGQFYLTDMTVLKVMFSAIVTAMLGLFWLSRVGLLDLTRVVVPGPYIAPQAIGGIVFGAGFVMGGLCPGTSCVSAATGRRDGLAVVLGMAAGVLLFGLAFPMVRSLYEATPLGATTLPELLHVPPGVVVFGVTAMAVGMFAGATTIERRVRRRRGLS
jgi:uncharacterized membrane protein YedE/YeeE